MARRSLPVAGLLALAFVPGCFFTESTWDWAEQRATIEGATAAAVTSWRRDEGETFRVRVRYTDEHEREVRVNEDVPGGPADLFRSASPGRGDEHSAELVLMAVRRGLVSRAFASDPRYAPLDRYPDFQDACVAPLVSPTFVLGEGRYRQLRLVGDDGVPVPIETLAPQDRYVDRPGRKIFALLVSPVTLVLDAATLPVQGVVLLMVGLMFS